MKEYEFFFHLLEKTKKAYLDSEMKNKNWYYSVFSTKLVKNSPLIVGFNWGVDKDGNHQPQKEYPQKSFIEIYDELGSFKRTIPYFQEYHPQALNGVQTNFCFFRSEKERQIKPNDLQKTILLFEELVEYLEPSILISFSSKLRDYLLEEKKLIDIEKTTLQTARNEISIIKGNYQFGNNEVGFSYLPHPNYPLENDLRKAAWEYVFKNN